MPGSVCCDAGGEVRLTRWRHGDAAGGGRTQRSPVGDAEGRVRLLRPRHRPAATGAAHRPRAAPRRRRGRAVLVGVRALLLPGRGRGHRHPGADRRGALHGQSLSARAGPGHLGRGAAAGGRARRTDRQPARGRGRPQHRQLPRHPAIAVPARGALSDPHPQREHRLGRLGHRRAPARWPERVRSRGRPGDEPARHAGGSVPRLGRHDARRAGGQRGPGDLLPLLGPGRLRSSAERARRRAGAAARQRRDLHDHVRAGLRLAGRPRVAAGGRSGSAGRRGRRP